MANIYRLQSIRKNQVKNWLKSKLSDVGNTQPLLTVQQYRELQETPANHKYGARACYEDGYRFDSETERTVYRWLKIEQLLGNVRYFLQQVPFRLPGKITMRLDFVPVWADERMTHLDAKGVITRDWENKRKQVEALYNIEIQTISPAKAKQLLHDAYYRYLERNNKPLDVEAIPLWQL